MESPQTGINPGESQFITVPQFKQRSLLTGHRSSMIVWHAVDAQESSSDTMSQTKSQNLKQLFREVIRLAPVAVVVCDHQNVIRIANAKAAEFLDTSAIADSVYGLQHTGPALTDVMIGFDLDEVQAMGRPVEQKVLVGETHRLFEFQINRVDLDDFKWTIIYFNEIDKQRKRERLLEKEASTDELSGLANRRAFQRTMESNQHRPLTLAIIDIDHFKSVNDDHGHLVGDEVVRHTSKLLTRFFADNAILVSRMGGDEFSLLFETTDPAEILNSLQAFRKSIAEIKLPECDSNVTVSIGTAVSYLPVTGSRTLLTHADRQLYVAKEAGRNQVAHVTLGGSDVVD